MARKATEVWFTLRLTAISLLINLVSLTYVLFYTTKDSVTEAEATVASAKAGLLLLCSLGFDEIMYFLYVNLNTFENELISIERC